MKIAKILSFILCIFCWQSISWANSMCMDLCIPCADSSENANCQKADALCGCFLLLDSLKQVRDIEQNNLAQQLKNSCNKSMCSRKITFENGTFVNIDVTKSALTKEQRNLF